MAPPTQRLTARAAALLGEDVVLAVRVRKGPRHGGGKIDLGFDDSPFSSGLALLLVSNGMLPTVVAFQRLRRTVKDLFSSNDILYAVLAFMASGDRLLLGRSQYPLLRPSHLIRRLGGNGPTDIDMDLLVDRWIPELEIDDEYFIMNSTDFGVFTRAVVNGDLGEPELAKQLTPYYERARARARLDPGAIRGMLLDESPSGRAIDRPDAPDSDN